MDKQTESEVAGLKALNRRHLESLRRKDALHSAELEKKRRLEWISHQQQLEELTNFKKALIVKDKELAQLAERLLFKQAECDKLDSEVKRLRSADSWKAISPSSSDSDLTASHVITVRERDMAMRNSELSFRIRTLEDNNAVLREQKLSLEKNIGSVRDELSPLKDQNGKLKVRCNELNATVRSRERKLNQLSQEMLDVKSSHQQLEEEFGRQKKRLKQLFNQCSDSRTQNEKLKFKNDKLKDAYDILCVRVKELEESSSKDLLQGYTLSVSLPNSNVQDDDCSSVSSSSSQLQEQIDQLEFDRDELDAKYTEMKSEYKDIRNKYKALCHHCQKLQVEHDALLLQVQREHDMDKLSLEREVVLLRCMRDENVFDETRQKFVLLSLKEEVKKYIHRIESLESFIIEQDESVAKKEAKWKKEYCRLNGALLAVHLKQPVVDPEAVIQLDYMYDDVEFESSNQDSTLSQAKEPREDLQMISSEAAYLRPREWSTVLLKHASEYSEVPVGLNAPAHFDKATQTTSQSEHVDGDITGSKHTQPFSHNIARVQDGASQTHYGYATNHVILDHSDHILCEKCQLKEDDHSSEIIELQHQLSEAQEHGYSLQHQLSEAREHGYSLQSLLEELDMKLNDQENACTAQAEEQKKCIIALQDKERKWSDIIRTRMIFECDKETVVELAKEIGNSMLQVEEAHIKSEPRQLLSNLEVLRESTETFLKVILNEEFLLSRADRTCTPREILPQESYFDPHPELCRAFLVVMDYDPQSLCITGQPDLELSVQSGTVVTVFGEMDEKGYYTASCNGTLGILPANFIQEVDLHDEKLIGRLMKQGIIGILNQDNDNNENMTESGSDMSTASGFDSSVHTKGGSVSSVHGQGEEHQFLGLYDYDPLTSSASVNPEFELSFKEGSLITVFGQKMSDGYYIGELNGQRGLVPADFIADTSTEMNSPLLQVKTKAVIALYDYKPLSDSPNVNSETELRFQAGDHIVIYGNMHSDGFYTGQLKGKFGLVPSNYVKELE